MPTTQPVPDEPRRKGKKRWLAALVAAALAVVEVIIPAATPLAEVVVSALDLERQLGPRENELPLLDVQPEPKPSASSSSSPP